MGCFWIKILEFESSKWAWMLDNILYFDIQAISFGQIQIMFVMEIL